MTRFRPAIRLPGFTRGALAGLCLLAGAAWAQVPAPDALPRHPLETRALTDPETVLAQLPGELERAAGDARAVALLELAHANACRVMADWNCQREAGAAAAAAGERAADGILQVRGLIAQARGHIALQDYTRGEQLLASAQLLLKRTPSPELSADIYLAYSSLSEFIGKHESGLRYAGLGLDALDGVQAPLIRTRLLRNQARAQSRLGQLDAARVSLADATQVASELVDPKLHAELALETARVARQAGDIDEQRRMGMRILELGQKLQNSQLSGMGEEVLGLAALDAGDADEARRRLQAAAMSFRDLGLERDELRVTRQLLDRLIEDRANPTVWRTLAQRFLSLERDIAQNDRAKAADDFEARLRYAQQEMEVMRLENEAALQQERAQALAESSRLSGWLMASAMAIMAILAVFFVLQRRTNQRLERTLAARRESESRATDLLRLSKGMVFLHDLNGRLVMVNLATAEALGTLPEHLVGRALGEYLADGSRSAFEQALRRLAQLRSDEATLTVRGNGGERHWQYSGRLSDNGGYAIGHAVDVTEQRREAEALREESLRDALTGAYNRRWIGEFERRVGTRRWAVVNVDLDKFKQINDTRGHDEGDRVLVAMTRYLQNQVGPEDAVIRSGGDEFLLLLADGDGAAAQALIGRLKADMDAAPCRYSLGFAVRESDERLGDTLARADADMYATRRAARERRG
ncbi:MAG: diguanylate cyclase [Rhodanobacteraceae bacterium]|nr:diguanylate cyclase [Rhodanobacteraceae bacterium]